MTDFVCPQNIQNMFDAPDEKTKAEGRKLAFEWATSIVRTQYQIGDRIYMPGVGWLEKTEPGIQ